MNKVRLDDLFGGIFSDKSCVEPPKSDKVKYLRQLEEELVDLRKEVYALRKEVSYDGL